MSATTIEQPSNAAVSASSGALLRSLEAIKNIRALLLLGITFLSASVVAAGFVALGSKAGSMALPAFGGLLAMIIFFYGVSAVGILMMRQVQGNDQLSIKDAVLLSVFTSHRLLGVMILQGLVVLAAFFVLALVLYICKIPGIGPFLYTFVFPLSAVFMGVLVFSFIWVMLPLAGPAVWSGLSVFQVIARLLAITRHKLVLVVMLQFVLFLITGFAAGFIFSVVMTGTFITSGLSMGILGVGSAGLDSIAGLMGMFSGGGSGYTTAAAIGGGLLFAVAMVIPGLIFTMGACIIFIETTRDLNFAAAEANLNNQWGAVRQKAEEAKERARALAAQTATSPMTPAAAGPVIQASPPAVQADPHCPNCGAQVHSDDLFCGNCAHKLSQA